MYKVLSSKPTQIILESVREYRDMLAPTYGPAGNGVLIGIGNKAKLVDDGQMASNAIEVKSELHNAVISFIKEAAEKTNSRVGDGTTTSVIIMAAIVEALMAKDEYSFTIPKSLAAEAQKLKLALKEATDAITKAAKKIKTKEELQAIAYNSYNNETISHLIADLVHTIGISGVISVDESQSTQTESTTVQGLEIEKGFASPYLSTGKDRTFKNPKILLSLKGFERFPEIVETLEPEFKLGYKDFVIIAESFSDEVIAGVVVNNARGTNIMLIQSPGYGEYKEALMGDIATLTGATVLNPKIGKDFIFGTAEKVVVSKTNTLIISNEHKADVEKRAKSLVSQETANDFDKNRLEHRAAALTGGIGVIKVGAHTESEMLTMKAKIEDAVHSTQAALRSGVVSGGGLTYQNITTSSETLNVALKAPRLQLMLNGAEFLDKDAKDPAEVLIAALESAVSIACGLITTGSIIAEKREEKNDY